MQRSRIFPVLIQAHGSCRRARRIHWSKCTSMLSNMPSNCSNGKQLSPSERGALHKKGIVAHGSICLEGVSLSLWQSNTADTGCSPRSCFAQPWLHFPVTPTRIFGSRKALDSGCTFCFHPRVEAVLAESGGYTLQHCGSTLGSRSVDPTLKDEAKVVTPAPQAARSSKKPDIALRSIPTEN